MQRASRPPVHLASTCCGCYSVPSSQSAETPPSGPLLSCLASPLLCTCFTLTLAGVLGEAEQVRVAGGVHTL
jgi:hypothetical protein